MNQQVDNKEYEFLWQLLANPADNNHSHIFNLQSLVNDYPHSGILYALLMPNGDKRNLKHAAAYFNPVTLHKLATAPNSLRVIKPEQVVQNDEPSAVPADVYFNVPKAEPFVPPAPEPEAEYYPVEDDSVTEETVVQEGTTPAQEEAIPADNTFAEWKPTPAYTPHEDVYNTFSEPVPVDETNYQQAEEPVTTFAEPEPVNYAYAEPEPIIPPAIADTYTQPEAIEEAPVQEYTFSQPDVTSEPVQEENTLEREFNDYQQKHRIEPSEPVYSYEDKTAYFHQDIEDEIYDEIVSIEDIGLEQLALLSKESDQVEVPESIEPEKDNYFVFEPPLVEDIEVPETKAASTVPAPLKPVQKAQYRSNVSMYNDEKMPYTFMWWLDKTRREHADMYQPYLANTPPVPKPEPQKKKVVDELQQQYYENIVSTSSINDLDQIQQKKVAPPVHKEDKIIDRFIQEMPQIKHPSDIKLDSENKAKKSSEDKDELVTETLARIYTEQMLYHKAITTYKKLMLKFPEKSLYFAGQIEQLESKIN